MPNNWCIVPQCTTSEAATTRPDSASSTAAPIAAGRIVSVSHAGTPRRPNSRWPTLDPTPIAAPRACTANTAPKALSALGVCRVPSTEAASCTTASAMAARNSGPPMADAAIQRVISHDPLGEVICAVPRAVAQTIRAVGASGSTPSSWPVTVTGT